MSRPASFRRRDARARWELVSGPSMTPMVDVVLVILIFFMASAALIGPEWLLRVSLAQASPKDATTTLADDPFALPPTRFVVHLSASGGSVRVGGLGLDGATMDQYRDRLETMAREIGADALVIVIEADDEVAYEAVVRARDLAAEAGIHGVGVR